MQTLSSIFLLRGRIFESLDNCTLAAESFKEALRMDVYCSEGFQALTQHHILSADEEKDLLQGMPFREQCSDDDVDLLPFLYRMRLKKYDRPTVVAMPPEGFRELTTNPDLMVQQAETQFYNCDFNECIRLTSGVLKLDPYHTECLPIHNFLSGADQQSQR